MDEMKTVEAYNGTAFDAATAAKPSDITREKNARAPSRRRLPTMEESH